MIHTNWADNRSPRKRLFSVLACEVNIDSLNTTTDCSKCQHKATIFLFLGLRISWPEKRVGRSEKKKKKKFQIINRPYYVKL